MGAKQTKHEESHGAPAAPQQPSAQTVDLPAVLPSQPELPAMIPYDLLDLSKLPEEPRTPGFGIWDVFFWRDAPDWYYKTFISAGFMFSFSALRQYLDRDQLEVFLPPRAKILPESMRRGYRNREIVKSAMLKTGLQTTSAAATSGILFAGAYYLGDYRGQHTWTNFTVSGAAAGAATSLWMIWPPRLRTTLFGAALGAALASGPYYLLEATGTPFWDERHDFEGWWWGTFVDRKRDRREQQALKLKLEQQAQAQILQAAGKHAAATP